MEAAFKKFASKANGAELTSADVNKWAKDSGILGKNLTSNHIDIAFSKVKVKGAKSVYTDIQTFYTHLVCRGQRKMRLLFCRKKVREFRDR